MAAFDAKSRYIANAETYMTTDARGREVAALTPAAKPVQTKRGEHRRRDGQRLDHLANFYLGDPLGFWRLAEHGDVMLPDALAETPTVPIPNKT